VNFVVLYRTWQKDTRGSDWLQTFSCLSKAKINGLKELLESKIRWYKHSKTPLGAITE